MVCNQISRFAFSSKTLKNANEEKTICPQGSQTSTLQRKNLIQSSNEKIHSPTRPSACSLGSGIQPYLPPSSQSEQTKGSQSIASSTNDKCGTVNTVYVYITRYVRMLIYNELKNASSKTFYDNTFFRLGYPNVKHKNAVAWQVRFGKIVSS